MPKEKLDVPISQGLWSCVLWYLLLSSRGAAGARVNDTGIWGDTLNDTGILIGGIRWVTAASALAPLDPGVVERKSCLDVPPDMSVVTRYPGKYLVWDGAYCSLFDPHKRSPQDYGLSEQPLDAPWSVAFESFYLEEKERATRSMGVTKRGGQVPRHKIDEVAWVIAKARAIATARAGTNFESVISAMVRQLLASDDFTKLPTYVFVEYAISSPPEYFSRMLQGSPNFWLTPNGQAAHCHTSHVTLFLFSPDTPSTVIRQIGKYRSRLEKGKTLNVAEKANLQEFIRRWGKSCDPWLRAYGPWPFSSLAEVIAEDPSRITKIIPVHPNLWGEKIMDYFHESCGSERPFFMQGLEEEQKDSTKRAHAS